MYWTNLHALEEQIVAQKISDHQIYPYLIAYALLGRVLLHVSDFHWPYSVVYVLLMGISFLGCKQLYALAKKQNFSFFCGVLALELGGVYPLVSGLHSLVHDTFNGLWSTGHGIALPFFCPSCCAMVWGDF